MTSTTTSLLFTSLPVTEDLVSDVMVRQTFSLADSYLYSQEFVNQSLLTLNDSLANVTLMNVTATNTSEEEGEMCDIPEEELDMCHLQVFDTIEKQIRLGCEIIIVILFINMTTWSIQFKSSPLP